MADLFTPLISVGFRPVAASAKYFFHLEGALALTIFLVVDSVPICGSGREHLPIDGAIFLVLNALAIIIEFEAQFFITRCTYYLIVFARQVLNLLESAPVSAS